MTPLADPAVLVIIPARGGSKGIPRKNLRALDGRPLISYAIASARRVRFAADVVVTSDDPEILAVARELGAIAHLRDPRLGDDAATLDEVVCASYPAIVEATGRRYDVVVTLQPTSPLLSAATIDAAIERFLDEPGLDTVLTATDDTHLRWVVQDDRFVPAYRERVNRQQLEPTFRETGGLVACRSAVLASGSRIGRAVSLLLVSGPEAIDIDTGEDWAIAEWYLSRRDVLFVVAGDPEIGLGHVFNTLTLANELVRHRIRFLVTHPSELAEQAIAERNYAVLRQRPDRDLVETILELEPDVVINDRLDTRPDEIRPLKLAGITVINFEDLGDGARDADLVVNAIYPEREALRGHYFGPDYFCLRSEFLVADPGEIRAEVETVLLSFGGVDPNNLTRRVLEAIHPICVRDGIRVVVIAGLGYRAFDSLAPFPGIEVHRSVGDMAGRIRDADVVFTSAGRTVFEVAAIGTPGIVLAQNARELTHFFASEEHGFINLGLGNEAARAEIAAALEALVTDADRRRQMHAAMLDNELRTGTARVVQLIETTIGGR